MSESEVEREITIGPSFEDSMKGDQNAIISHPDQDKFTALEQKLDTKLTSLEQKFESRIDEKFNSIIQKLSIKGKVTPDYR